MRYNPHKRTFENHRVCSRQLLVRVINDFLMRSVSRFSAKDQFIKMKSRVTSALLKNTEFVLDRYKWLPNTECVTIFCKDLFNEVRPSQAHSWKPPSLFSTVNRARDKWLPNTECVTIFYKDQFNEVQSSQAHFWKPPSLFSTVIRACDQWLPNTECVTIFYKISVQWGTILPSALLKTTEFVLDS